MLATIVKPRGAGNTRLPAGIEPMQSSRWQRLAGMPEHVFERYCAQCAKDKVELTQAGFVEFFLSQNKQAKKAAAIARTPTFSGGTRCSMAGAATRMQGLRALL